MDIRMLYKLYTCSDIIIVTLCMGLFFFYFLQGASIIRMMRFFLGEDTFREGLKVFYQIPIDQKQKKTKQKKQKKPPKNNPPTPQKTRKYKRCKINTYKTNKQSQFSNTYLHHLTKLYVFCLIVQNYLQNLAYKAAFHDDLWFALGNVRDLFIVINRLGSVLSQTIILCSFYSY